MSTELGAERRPQPDGLLLASGVLVSAWLILLLTGFAGGGAVHLLLLAALALGFKGFQAR